MTSLCSQHTALTRLLFFLNWSGLLVNLEDSGSPILAERAQRMSRPSSLQTSDRHSLLRYFGLPLDIFGQVRAWLVLFSFLYSTVHNIRCE